MMIRELTALLCAAMLAGPAMAQDSPATPAADAGAGAATAADASADSEDDEDDDDDGQAGSTSLPNPMVGGSGEGAAQAEADEREEQAAPAAAVEHHDFGPSGIMTRANREDLPPLTLAAGKPVADGEYMLKSGGYYRITIAADGSQELALSGGDFFRAVWINEVIVNDIEIRPLGVHSIEFDAAGEAEISFIAIMPGRYTLSIPGSSGETQQAVFIIQ